MSTSESTVTSSAANPDLDWSQVKETVLMLKLAAAQVDFSLKEGNGSVDVLTGAFTGIAADLSEIEKNTTQLSEKYNMDEADKLSLNSSCHGAAGKMQQAIIAFQFYDTLVQRLDHVVNSLSQLGDLVSSPAKLYAPHEWKSLQDTIRGRYTMSNERELFDAIVAGEDMAKVLEKMHQLAITEQDDIELF